MRPQGVRLPQTARADMESAPTDLYQPISRQRALERLGDLVGAAGGLAAAGRALHAGDGVLGLHLGQQPGVPFRLPSQPPMTCTLLMVWSSFSSTIVRTEQVPLLL